MLTEPPPAWVIARQRAIGVRLRQARTRANLSQERLAELAGIDRKTVVRLEGGQRDVRLTVWLRLAHALGVPLADLLRE
ncbi:helix-turn-helix transcriptional regulator [Streptomyces sp. A0592]|uniref:helix-turn-helix transcriptional regulator n=1 Tax=Streptomyces sp. A0592 TaxID=2563099 RepID=UPI00109EA2B3|nr:helix-turn-helix transcriptional regulator [Streptomyces sp. A0592]THA82708.1 XRE family transcriptional regulator [Streptomyces sp. A0592]